MRRLSCALVLICLLALGCAVGVHQPLDTARYPHARKLFDITVGWNLLPRGDGALVEGYVRNNRYLLIRGMVLGVALLAPDGSERSKETVLIHPSELPVDQTTIFTLLLRETPRPGESLRFDYRYRAVEGEGEALFWMHSFTVPAATD